MLHTLICQLQLAKHCSPCTYGAYYNYTTVWARALQGLHFGAFFIGLAVQPAKRSMIMQLFTSEYPFYKYASVRTVYHGVSRDITFSTVVQMLY